MKVGDLVKRHECQGFYPTRFGVILDIHMRDPNNFPPEQYPTLEKVTVLQDNGTISTWYAFHLEVISESL